jgi:hypothetical protein
MKAYFLFICFFFVFLNCKENKTIDAQKVNKTTGLKEESTELIVNDSVIGKRDLYAIVEPLYLNVDITKSEQVYKESMSKFTESQQLVFALDSYFSEIQQGGHEQFFFSNTGIVWKEVVSAFQKLGLKDNYNVLNSVVKQLGGNPSLDYDTRVKELEKIEFSLDSLDERIYQIEQQQHIQDKIYNFILQHKADFYYKGQVPLSQ